MNKRLPVVVITGFLGSGKTTLLRHILTHTTQKLAVLVNEFGTIGLDGDLIRSCGFCPDEDLDGRVVELNNGCLCCTVQEDFLPTMETLLKRSDQIDGILVETSGLALPRPLLQALSWPEIKAKVHVNGVVALVDGEALSKGSPVGDMEALLQQQQSDPNLDHSNSVDELFSDQLEFADLVLISRGDIISSNQLEAVKNTILRKVRSGTNILSIANGNLDPSIILGVELLDEKGLHDQGEHDHNHLEIKTSSLRIEIDIEKALLEDVLIDLAIKYQIVRMKGRCWLPGKKIPLQIQMVGPRLSTWYEPAPEEVWKPSDSGIDLVAISFVDGACEALALALENQVTI